MNEESVRKDNSLAACSERDHEVGHVWRARMAIDPNDVPCYDCASNYIYQYEPCEVESIQRGLFGYEDGWNTLPICPKHHALRQERKSTDEQNTGTLSPD